MKLLIDYKYPCSKEILSKYGTIEYESKIMTIVVLDTNKPIDIIKNIEGIRMVCEERNGKLLQLER